MHRNMLDTTDVLGRRVCMTQGQWEFHVLYDKPWMSEFAHLVHLAVEQPTAIYYDAVNRNRAIYYAEELIPDTGELLKVVVDFSDPGMGRVITVYPTTKIKAGEDKRWPL